MTNEKMAQVIADCAWTAYGATLVGNAAPKVEKLRKQLKELKPGALVLETSTYFRQGNKLDSVGYFIRQTDEPLNSDGWPDDEPVPTERVYYIETLDGREFRWVNADFIRVPSGPEFRRA